MEIKVLFFASYREKTGIKSDYFEINPGATLGDLIQIISRRFPNIKTDTSKIVAAINEEFCGHNTVLEPENIVALIPPVSGG
jgi:molybdopterin synthase sulfur carrier subunit